MSSNNANTSAKSPRAGQPAKPQQRPAAASSKAKESSASRPGPSLVKPAPVTKARQARLQVSRVEPWSVLKLSFLLSVALGIVTVVAAIVIWSLLDLTGVFRQINGILGGGTGFDIRSFASLGQVASFATIVAVVNVVLLTALAMLSAVLYNISATLVGGIGVTLTDD